MSLTYTIPTKFVAEENFSRVIPNMKAQMRGFAQGTRDFVAKQNNLFSKIGIGRATKTLLNYAGAGSILTGVAATGKAVMDYETAIQSLSAVTGVTGNQLDTFKAEIKSLSAETKKSSIDVAGSFEVIGSAMSQYLNDPKALRQIADAGITLSKASRQELVPTLENLTSIMNQFDIKANKAADTVNRLTAGEIVGSLRTSEVAEALKEYGASAYSANVTLSESVALAEALAKQLKTDKIGVGARNILTVLDAAKGLDKKARKDLKKAGVDLGFLMDPTKTLSQRLHEVAKISGDATKIVSVFGKENKTAAQVIFNQLGTYDDFLAKIKITNESTKQAAINSNTFASSLDRLKNTWINYIATNESSQAGLEKLKSGAKFLADNIDTVVSTTIMAVKAISLWKAGLIIAKGASTAYSVALGIQNFVQGASIGLLEADTIAQRTSMIAKRANAVATGILSGEISILNVVMSANPIFIFTAGLAALGAGLYFAAKRERELREEYQKTIDLNVTKEIDKQTEAVKKLAWQYWNLGQSAKDATANAIKFTASSIDLKRSKVESRIRQTKQELDQEKNKLYFADLFTGTLFGRQANTGRRAELAEQLLAQQQSARTLATDRASINKYAQDQFMAGNISRADVSPAFPKANTSPEITNDFQRDIQEQQSRQNFKFFEFDYQKMGAEIAKALNGKQKLDLNITGLPAGATISSTNNVTAPKSY